MQFFGPQLSFPGLRVEPEAPQYYEGETHDAFEAQLFSVDACCTWIGFNAAPRSCVCSIGDCSHSPALAGSCSSYIALSVHIGVGDVQKRRKSSVRSSL